MFINFNEIFENKKQEANKVPESMVKYLNKNLPKGIHYESDDYGFCHITSDSGELTIGGFTPKLTEEQKKIIGPNPSIDKILEYSYNAQEPIALKLKEDRYILVNGKYMSIESLNINPMLNLEYINNTTVMIPSPFPEPFKLEIKLEDIVKRVSVARKPIKSLNEIYYETDESEPLFITYLINKENLSAKFTISYNLEKVDSIRALLETVKIYNGFIDNKTTICNMRPTSQKIEAKKYPKEIISFWEKVYKIECKLGLHFIPFKEELNDHLFLLVERLYQSLINNNPVRVNEKLKYISCKTDENFIKKYLNKPILFGFHGKLKIDLFGEIITLYTLEYVYNGILKDIEKQGDQFRVNIDCVDENNEQYTSMLTFTSEDELDKYEKKHKQDVFELFKNAKTENEYINAKSLM